MADSEGNHLDAASELRHLLRSVKTSLELAIMARAPTDLVNRLARVSGLLDALSQLPEEGPVRDLMAPALADALSAVELWRVWERARTPVA